MTTMTTGTQSNVNNSTSQREEFKHHGDNLKRDVKNLTDDLASAAHTAKECVQHEAEYVADIAKSGGEKAQEMHEMMCRNVKRHPTAAVLTTLGVGILVGRVLAGR